MSLAQRLGRARRLPPGGRRGARPRPLAYHAVRQFGEVEEPRRILIGRGFRRSRRGHTGHLAMESYR